MAVFAWNQIFLGAVQSLALLSTCRQRFGKLCHQKNSGRRHSGMSNATTFRHFGETRFRPPEFSRSPPGCKIRHAVYGRRRRPIFAPHPNLHMSALKTPARSNSRSRAIGHTAPSLPDLVAEKLLQAILDGNIPSGARLPEIALAQEHKVSRATIRDALGQLERHRFVEKLPRFGCRVIEVDLGELAELYELRAMLLGLASSRAARLANESAIARFTEMAQNLRALAGGGASASLYKREALAAQAQVIAMADSKWLTDMYQLISNQSLWRVMVRSKNAVFSSKSRREQSAKSWVALAHAIATRNPGDSEAAARALIDESWQYVREQRSGKTHNPEGDRVQ